MRSAITLFIAFIVFTAQFSTQVFADSSSEATIVYYQGFEGDFSDWYPAYGGNITHSTDIKYNGSRALLYSGRTASWHSPAVNIYNLLKTGGAGYYNISMVIRVDNLDELDHQTRIIIRGTRENSFISNQGNNNYYYSVTPPVDLTDSAWCYLSGNLRVLNSDIQNDNGTFNLMIDVLKNVDNQNIYIDNVIIRKINDHVSNFNVAPSGKTMSIGQTQVFMASYTSFVTYRISNSNVATVNNMGVVTAVAEGKARLEICRLDTGQCEYAYIIVKGWYSITDGMYYISNFAQEGYLQTNNNSANKLELWKFDNEYYQNWCVTYINGGGYYKITRNNNDAYALTATEYDINTQTDIKYQTYNNIATQHWYIEPIGNEQYKIWPDSDADKCMSARYDLSVDGTDVLLKQYSEKSIWYFHRIGLSDVTLSTINYNDGVNRASCFGSVMTSLRKFQYDTFNVITVDSITKNNFLSLIENSEIFVFRGHGSEGDESTSIKLGNNDYAQRLYSSDICLDGVAQVDFSNLKLLMYISCKSGGNCNTGLNLVNASAIAGAEYVIGFQDTISSQQANKWTEYFFDYYSNGNSVDFSCYHATQDLGIYTGNLDTYIIRRR